MGIERGIPTPTLIENLPQEKERKQKGLWIPACGGTEVPFTVNGRRLLYCWQPSTGRHAYMDLGTDMTLSSGSKVEQLGKNPPLARLLV